MNNSVFNEELLEKSNIIGVHFSVEQMEQFYKYMNLLIEWNEKMNLTAIIEPEEIIQKHSKDFNGTLSDAEVMKLVGISRNSYYKYKRELRCGMWLSILPIAIVCDIRTAPYEKTVAKERD